MLGVTIAKLEGKAAEDERQQHQEDREIDRRHDDGEGDREGGEEPDATEDEPGLVAVPDRRDRVHDEVARTAVGGEAVEHADAEIEAVERDVEEDADREDDGPDRGEAERRHYVGPSDVGRATAGDRAALIGAAGWRLAIGLSSSAVAGPRHTMRSMRRTPVG